MPRTTSILVGGIIEVDASIPLDPFIDTANQLVTELCADSGYSDERLEMIERYLAAHFYCHREPRPTLERAGSVHAAYQSAVDLFLSTSHYGQTACLLDTAGALTILNRQRAKRTISVTWAANDIPIREFFGRGIIP